MIKLLILLLVVAASVSGKIHAQKIEVLCDRSVVCKSYIFINRNITLGEAGVSISKDAKNTLSLHGSQYTHCLRNHKFIDIVSGAYKKYGVGGNYCYYNYTDDYYGTSVSYYVTNMNVNCSKIEFNTLISKCYLTREEIEIFLSVTISIMCFSILGGVSIYVWDAKVKRCPWIHPDEDMEEGFEKI